MREEYRRPLAAGLIGTILFALVLDMAPILHAPRFNVPLWDGTFVTLNLTVAVIVGYVLEFAIGVLLAMVYRRWVPRMGKSPKTGILYGIAVWLFFMAIGIPLFDMVSPMVQQGLMLGPGFFLWRAGVMGPVTWLLALLLYGASLGYIVEAPSYLSS